MLLTTCQVLHNGRVIGQGVSPGACGWIDSQSTVDALRVIGRPSLGCAMIHINRRQLARCDQVARGAVFGHRTVQSRACVGNLRCIVGARHRDGFRGRH